MSRRPLEIEATIPEMDESEESDQELPSRRGSTTPLVKEGMELADVSLERIQMADFLELVELASLAGITEDPNLEDTEDMRERLVLIKRKQMGLGRGAEIQNSFASMHIDNKTKAEALLHLVSSVADIFCKISTESLSAVLAQEGHLTHNLLEELSERGEMLINRNSTVIIAGETNGGKSTFLNLLLGENILPTDVLHCTYSICRIMYSDNYSIHTVDYTGGRQDFYCQSAEEAKDILKNKVAKEGVKERLQGSILKEVILKMPSQILKCGVTLVDTPGIGEDELMDDVTMSFVKSTQASAFIYVIKSDTAGGIQEDRLLGFLRAIKQRYEADTMKEYFDPSSAMFVCHRWDTIGEAECEKVKQNALNKLANVWPGFSHSQTYFFSSKNTLKHLPTDPDFITDSYYDLLKGLKSLFDRASYNAVKHQYIWLKHLLQPASRHLKAMITHCIRGNEELDLYFQSVAENQEKLMMRSKENSMKLKEELQGEVENLIELVKEILLMEDFLIPRIDDFDDLLAECSGDKYLSKQSNREQLDDMILRSLIKYINRHVNDSEAVQKIEQKIVQSIEEHLGLFRCQIREIRNQILHGESGAERGSFDNPDSLNQSYSSMGSSASEISEFEEFQRNIIVEPSELVQTVNSMLLKRREKKIKYNHHFGNLQEASQSILGKVKDFFINTDKMDPKKYLTKRVKKICARLREDEKILNNIVESFVEWIHICVTRATESIPKFIKVNTTLMDNIREHRKTLQEDKEKLKMVMEDLEPSRDHLRGFGSLYMEDINAEMVDFTLPDRRVSSVIIPKDISVSSRPLDDSGFHGSGSKHRKVKSLWGRLQLASITVDGEKEKVILKTYTYDLEEKHFFSEIASLRYLDDDNIAQFFGMSRIRIAQSGGATFGKAVPEAPVDQSTEKVSAFVFKGDLVSAKVYCSNKIIKKQDFIPKFAVSLLNGLKYIHTEKLVHMELNLDTVMVDKETGDVKLCQMCKPREARFPTDLTETKTLSCVCLSPSVLQGHEYNNTDDIYAFGLLLWELLFPNKLPYQEERNWTLKDFIEKCHPENMLSPSLSELRISSNIDNVIRGTVLTKRGQVCMTVENIQSYLTDLQNDPAVVSFSRVRFKPIHRPDARKQISLEETAPHKHLYVKNSPPVRPPRKSDALKNKTSPTTPENHVVSKSYSQEDPSSTLSTRENGGRGRRSSEPAVLAANVLRLSEMKGIKPQKSSKVVAKLVKSTLLSMPFKAEKGENSELDNPSYIRTVKPSETIRMMHNSRRLSLPTASLTVPRSSQLGQSKKLPDVPELFPANMQRYNTPFLATLPHHAAYSNVSTLDFPSRLIPSESLPSLVPSLEERKNSFFSTDEKLADAWQSPPMFRKSYNGSSTRGVKDKSAGILRHSVHNEFSASNGHSSYPLDAVSHSSHCSAPGFTMPFDQGTDLEEDDTRPCKSDFPIKQEAASDSFGRLSTPTVRSDSVTLTDSRLNSSSSGGSANFSLQAGILRNSLNNSNTSSGRHSVSFDDNVTTLAPTFSNRSSLNGCIVAYSESSDEDSPEESHTSSSAALNGMSSSLSGHQSATPRPFPMANLKFNFK
ncbi:hypothetical protein Btru_043464 [Bulinus truncatus]|nr:hypothetical protein Btru_043464 [Bulinus truncatus]